ETGLFHDLGALERTLHDDRVEQVEDIVIAADRLANVGDQPIRDLTHAERVVWPAGFGTRENALAQRNVGGVLVELFHPRGLAPTLPRIIAHAVLHGVEQVT